MSEVKKDKPSGDLSPIDLNRGTNKRIDIETRLKKINQQFRQEYEIAKSMSKNLMNSTHQQKAERLETNQKINNQRRQNQLEIKRKQKNHTQTQLRKGISDILDSARQPIKSNISPQNNKQSIKNNTHKIVHVHQSPINTNRQKRQASSMKPSQSIEAYLNQYKMKLQRQKEQRQEVQSARKRLQYQNSKLLAELSSKNKYKQQMMSSYRQQKQALQNQICQLKSSLKQQNSRVQNQISKLNDTIQILQDELSRLKTQLCGSISNNSWMQQKSKLQKQIKIYKDLNYLKDQQKQDRLKLQKQLQTLQEQIETNIVTIEQQNIKYESTVSEFQKQLEELQQTNSNMNNQITILKKSQLKKQSEIKLYRSEIQKYKQSIQTKQIEYQDLQNQYKNLQLQFSKKEQFYLNLFQEEKESEIRNSIIHLENQLQKQKYSYQQLMLNLIDLETSNEQITLKLAEEIKLNAELEENIRTKTIQHQEAETEMENMFLERIKQIETQLISLRDEKSSKLQSQIDTKITEKNNERIINNLSLQIQKLQIQNEQLNQIIEQNKQTIQNLQHPKQIPSTVSCIATNVSSLDHIICQQIKQNQCLKVNIKDKDEQIFILKGQIQDFKRKIQSKKTELQILKLKNISDTNKLRREYEIQIEDLQCKIEINQRKYQILENKFKTKLIEVKKKNQFIQNVIVNKIGKQEAQDQHYFIQETRRFFNITAQEEIQTEIKIESTQHKEL